VLTWAFSVLFSAPEVDFDVRWAMIQLADMLVRPAEEAPPKLVIHIPVTNPTAAEAGSPALPTPKIKLFSGASKLPSRLEGLHPDRQPDAPRPFLAATPTVTTPSLTAVFPKAPLKLVLPRQPTEELIMEAAPPPIKPKKKKEKALSKAEKGGMSAMDLVACRSIIRKMVRRSRERSVNCSVH
jgi:transcription initiation factor TFIID subunit 2